MSFVNTSSSRKPTLTNCFLTSARARGLQRAADVLVTRYMNDYCSLTGPTAAASSAHPTSKNASGISPPSTRPPAAPRTAPRVQRRGASTPKRTGRPRS